jgi:hypothetical protein
MNPSPRALTARSPEDLLAIVPLVLGFHPEESLVMLTFAADRSAFHARVDLPPPEGREEVVDLLRSAAVRNRVDRVLFVLYTADPEAAFELAPEVVVGFAEARIEILDLIRADGERWFPLAGGPDHPGHAYDISTHPFAAQGVYDGTVTHGSRLALAESLTGPTGDVALVEQETPVALARVPALQRRAEARWLCEVLAAVDVPRVDLSAVDTARLVVALLDIDLRDVAWSHMSRANAADHVAFWTGVVRSTPDDFLAAPATLLAFAAWLAGQGALAWCALDRARAADPSYSLAKLVETALEGAVPPSTWQPIPPESHPLLNPA